MNLKKFLVYLINFFKTLSELLIFDQHILMWRPTLKFAPTIIITCFNLYS